MGKRKRMAVLATVFGAAGIGGFWLGERLDPVSWLKRLMFGPGSPRFDQRVHEAMQQ